MKDVNTLVPGFAAALESVPGTLHAHRRLEKALEAGNLFAAVWSLALLGIAQECWIAKAMRLTSLAIYLLMGWIAIFALEPLIQALTWNGFAWLLGGGLVYTFGIVFYLYDERFTHWHGIWHLFVLAGSAAHYTAILLFVV